MTTYFEVGGGGRGERANLAVLSLWLFRTVRLLDLSVLSHCWAESCLWISSRWKVPFSCWSWLHMLDPSLEVCRSWYYTVGSCNPVILSSMLFKCIRDHIISRYNSFQETVVFGVVFRFNREPSSKETIPHHCKCYIAWLVWKCGSLGLIAVL